MIRFAISLALAPFSPVDPIPDDAVARMGDAAYYFRQANAATFALPIDIDALARPKRPGVDWLPVSDELLVKSGLDGVDTDKLFCISRKWNNSWLLSTTSTVARAWVDPTPKYLTFMAHGDAKIVVNLWDGSVKYEGVTPDEAGLAFWAAVTRAFPYIRDVIQDSPRKSIYEP